MNAAKTKKWLADTEILIDAYQAAILAIVVKGAQEYTLDTAQSRQTVKKIDIPSMTTSLNSLISLCNILRLRLNQGGVPITRPVF